jgi:hypothetical protein
LRLFQLKNNFTLKKVHLKALSAYFMKNLLIFANKKAL